MLHGSSSRCMIAAAIDTGTSSSNSSDKDSKQQHKRQQQQWAGSDLNLDQSTLASGMSMETVAALLACRAALALSWASC